MYFVDCPGYSSGISINGILITEVIVERVVCNVIKFLSDISNMKLGSFSQIEEDWLIMVGVYKGKGYDDKEGYYLILKNSSRMDDFIFDEELQIQYNTGVLNISEMQAQEISEHLFEFGKDKLKQLPFFETFINTMCTIMETNEVAVEFYPFFNMKGGMYNPISNSITIRNNQSHFMIMHSLLHEYVHFLLGSEPGTEYTAQTMEQYRNNEEEFICNTVAWVVLHNLYNLFDIFKDRIERFFNAAKEVVNNPDSQESFRDTYYEELLIFENIVIDDINNFDVKTREMVSLLVDKICTDFNNCKNIKDFSIKQSGCVVLNNDDNKKLYDYIINELSPMFTICEDNDEICK